MCIRDRLRKKSRRNLPGDIRTAAIWYRPTDRTIRRPDYFLHETTNWLVLPYELSGLSIKELRENKEEIAPIIERLESLATKSGNKSAA